MREAAVLDKINRGAISTAEIVDDYLSSTVVSIIADSLFNKGYITRQPHPHDRRRVEFFITNKGRKAITTKTQ